MLMLRKGQEPEYVAAGQNLTGKRCDAIVLEFDDVKPQHRDWLLDCALTRLSGPPAGDTSAILKVLSMPGGPDMVLNAIRRLDAEESAAA